MYEKNPVCRLFGRLMCDDNINYDDFYWMVLAWLLIINYLFLITIKILRCICRYRVDRFDLLVIPDIDVSEDEM